MAATFSPNDAFDYAKEMLKRMPLERVRVRMLDDVMKIMWMAAPWRWTVGTLPTVTLVSSTQDYSIALPADFLYPISCYVTDGAEKPTQHLRVTSVLPANGVKGSPREVAITGAAGTTGQVRFSPNPGALPAGLSAITMYKKQAPKIIETNLDTTGILVFDDEWFWVYVSGVLWQAYLYGDDQRAGTVQYADGKVSFTGQRGVFEGNLQIMREREKLLLVDDDRQGSPDPARGK